MNWTELNGDYFIPQITRIELNREMNWDYFIPLITRIQLNREMNWSELRNGNEVNLELNWIELRLLYSLNYPDSIKLN